MFKNVASIKKGIVILIYTCMVVGFTMVIIGKFKDDRLNGRILYLKSNNNKNLSQPIVVADIEGKQTQYLINGRGSVSWANDGITFATGCEDDQKICTYKINDFPSRFEYPQPIIYRGPKPISELNLPDLCVTPKSSENNQSSISIIRSISWSFDDKKIAVVCGQSGADNKSVCILPLTGKSFCWPEAESKNIWRVNFSPIDDTLLVSGREYEKSVIYQTDVEGQILKYLTEGWSPDWSSDGNRVIFLGDMNLSSQPYKYPDIYVINKDGSGKRILYKNPYPLTTNNGTYYYTTFSCSETTGNCRLSWSKDERYVIINGNIGPWVATLIFRIDLQTGKITWLPLDGDFNIDPDWAPK